MICYKCQEAAIISWEFREIAWVSQEKALKQIYESYNAETHLIDDFGDEDDQNNTLSCDNCLEEFENELELNEHLKLHEMTSEVFVCEICNDEFPSSIYFNLHYLNNHDTTETESKDSIKTKISYEKNEQGRYVCQICNGTFSTRDSLSRHVIKHTSSKDFKCQLCPREFYFQRDYNAHMKQHYNPQKVNCPECNAIFTTNSSLKVF